MGDCYAIQKQATSRPSDGCDWLMDAQVLAGVFSEWPLEVAIYTRGGAERQRNPATALARLEYRVSSSNPAHAVPSLVSNLVFVQFVPLISLKGFQPMATSQPPLVPADFAKAMAGFAARATTSLPQQAPGALRPPLPSTAASSVHASSKVGGGGVLSTAQSAPAATAEAKTSLPVAKSIPAKRGMAVPPAPAAYNLPLFVEEPIESMSLAPIDATDAVERALLRLHARPAPLTQAILASPSAEPGQAAESSPTMAEHIRELQEDIRQMTEASAQERDRRQQLRQLLREGSDGDNKTVAQLIAAIQPLTKLRISRST